MKRCVETAVILVMSAVLTATALLMMQPYGMAGVALAFTLAGVYIALMVLLVTVKFCTRDSNAHPDVERQASHLNDAPPPYDQVVTKPPSYRTLFFPSPPRLLAALATNPGLMTPPGDTKTTTGLAASFGAPLSAADGNGLTTPLPTVHGTLPSNYPVTSGGVSTTQDEVRAPSEGDTTERRTGEEGPTAPERAPGSSAPSSPPSRPRTPRRVRFELADSESDGGQESPEPFPDESIAEADSSKS
ncbi:kinesin-like protein KIF21B [Penaeus chinensis]|uniref:kinesin-like protein KIF21B n=1 Tax=Penaeus chinensis TaxID=139456 RepID=UPI001FB5CE8E|nr:kinesin-like protein KIF21B [Penaeus chinensis]